MWLAILVLVLVVCGLGFVAVSVDYWFKAKRHRASRIWKEIATIEATVAELNHSVAQLGENLHRSVKTHVGPLVDQHLAGQSIARLKDHMQRVPIKYLSEAGISSLLDLQRQSPQSILAIRGVGAGTANEIFRSLKQILVEIHDGELDFFPSQPFHKSSSLDLANSTYAYVVERKRMDSAIDDLRMPLDRHRPEIQDARFAAKPWGWMKTLSKGSTAKLNKTLKTLEDAEHEISPRCVLARQLAHNFKATGGLPPTRESLDDHFASNQDDYLSLFSHLLPQNQPIAMPTYEMVHDEPPIKVAPVRSMHDIVTSTRPPQVRRLQWAPSGEVIKLCDRMIAGNIYTTDVPLGWDGEPSAICKRLSVDSNQRVDEDLPYYPNYESLSPGQRGFYLDWLAGGRRMSNPDQLPTGYLFLFFYGIERRVIVEGDRDSSLWNKVFDLLQIYGMTRRSRSIPSYFGDFLHFVSYSWGAEDYSLRLPALLEMQGERLSETALGLALAHHFLKNQPIDWKLGHLVAMGLEDSRRSVVIKRTGNAFREMFMTRFQESYPQGMPLKASKRGRAVRYQAGNASLSPGYGSSSSQTGSPFVIQVPGVLGIRSQFRPLAEIWNRCIEDLSGYSRAVGKINKENGASSQDLLRAHLALPHEIRKGKPHPLEIPYRDALDGCTEEDGLIFAPVAILASMSGIEERQNLTQKQSENVALLVESFGDSLAPHPAILNLPLAWDQEVAILPNPAGGEPSTSLGGLLRLLYLAILVASADGVIDDDELEVFHSSSGIEDDFGKAQAKATQAVLVRDTNVASKRLQNIAKSVHASERMTVFKLMVHIACCDEVLSSDENRMLRRIAKALKLGSDALDDVMSEDAAFQTVTVVHGRKILRGETIPKPSKAPAFSLDMERISALTAETAEVVSILSRAIEDESEEEDEPEIVSAEKKPATKAPEWMNDLDERYRPALMEILINIAGQSFVLDEIAGRHHMLPDDLIDGVNAWSDETLGDFLIELDDEGQVSIIEDLIPTNQ